jgi:hypothetical protein
MKKLKILNNNTTKFLNYKINMNLSTLIEWQNDKKCLLLKLFLKYKVL